MINSLKKILVIFGIKYNMPKMTQAKILVGFWTLLTSDPSYVNPNMNPRLSKNDLRTIDVSETFNTFSFTKQ